MRCILINPESEIVGEGLPEYRMWPHLGMLAVGTRIQNIGCQVVLWDELVQGPCKMEELVEPGDIVGLSMVATGIERGMRLAAKAKQLGACFVIAGNDAAIFRAQQLLTVPNSPIDAVCVSNNLDAIENCIRAVIAGESVDGIHDIATRHVPGLPRSNESSALQQEASARRGRVPSDTEYFQAPRFDLYPQEYWTGLWQNYRAMLGHHSENPHHLRNSSVLFAQGCTRPGAAGDVCSYCTIAGVADVRMPTTLYLESLLRAYADFGITHAFNVTDSSLEMSSVARRLRELGAHFPDGLTVYGRAWGMAHHPECIEQWQRIGNGQLVINSGFDSGNENMLQRGIGKATQQGNRMAENTQAVQNVKGSGARLHVSFIFGSPGETQETCKATLDFFDRMRGDLGPQLQQCETDFFWLNHGSPASRIFYDYTYAQKLAALAGKEISWQDWQHHFAQHKNTLMVPESCQNAWYRFFTQIDREYAREQNELIARTMSEHHGAVPGRKYAFK